MLHNALDDATAKLVCHYAELVANNPLRDQLDCVTVFSDEHMLDYIVTHMPYERRALRTGITVGTTRLIHHPTKLWGGGAHF